jgi:hypothetical protein
MASEDNKIRAAILTQVANASAEQRDDLVDALNEVTHKRIMAVQRLREIAHSWAVTDQQGLFSMRILVEKIEKCNNDIEYAEQQLNMHDDPAGWQQHAENMFSY